MTQILVDVVLEDEAWGTLGLEAVAEQAAIHVLMYLGFDPDGFEVSLLGCDDARISGLNAEFRNKLGPTNVLSWPSESLAAATDGGEPSRPLPGKPGWPEALGDIAIARETCLAEADAAGTAPSHHVSHLVVHGVLHLLGYDHERDKDAALMERLEVEILERMGIPSPYSGRRGQISGEIGKET